MMLREHLSALSSLHSSPSFCIQNFSCHESTQCKSRNKLSGHSHSTEQSWPWQLFGQQCHRCQQCQQCRTGPSNQHRYAMRLYRLCYLPNSQGILEVSPAVWLDGHLCCLTTLGLWMKVCAAWTDCWLNVSSAFTDIKVYVSKAEIHDRDSWVHQEYPESTPKHKTDLWVSSNLTWQGKLWKSMESFLLLRARHIDISGDGGLLDQMSCYLQHGLLRGLPLQNKAYQAYHFRLSEQKKMQKIELKASQCISYWCEVNISKQSQQHRTACAACAFHGMAPGAPPSHTVAPCKAGSCPTFAHRNLKSQSKLNKSEWQSSKTAEIICLLRQKVDKLFWDVDNGAKGVSSRTQAYLQDQRYLASSQPVPFQSPAELSTECPSLESGHSLLLPQPRSDDQLNKTQGSKRLRVRATYFALTAGAIHVSSKKEHEWRWQLTMSDRHALQVTQPISRSK